ncbi:FMN-linked oxidoreductase [Teratosphaeria nubilosa]|uniref:FMN-linked oxidoreductase n=1 Tax=Teratosphaeria nubilosa TaxID=161662 RepID=A0A6G1LPD3_9PEZI|nr:FMN-linked oxidoreductase [Teratosphaeria nubilosa]
MAPTTYNASVPGIPFFAPRHAQSPGTPRDPKAENIPTLFKPLQIKGVTLRNRIVVAPMCQYSAAESGPEIGALTPYHIATLGHYALKGAALIFIEATGVQPNGRISPNCPGLWQDEQISGVAAVADFIHSQGGLVGLQLAHAGRKSSTVAPFVAAKHGKRSLKAEVEVGGWPNNVVGPSGGEDQVWDGKGGASEGYWPPCALSVAKIQKLVDDWRKAAERAVRAGVDVIEIHGAHGYLIHQFLSPVTNHRKDAYGGSFAGRTKILVDIVKALRSVLPSSMPLFLRLSATEWLEDTETGRKLGSWTVEDTIRIARIVSDLGVDLLDVSSGGNHHSQRINPFAAGDYQTKIAAQIRQELRAAGKPMLIGAVGLITEAEQARDLVEARDASIQDEAKAAMALTDDSRGREPRADVILVARQFMREPEWVLRVAWRLGVDVAWPSQSDRVRFPKL